MLNFDKKIIDKYWLEVSDLTIFEAAFWMLLGDPLNHNRFYPTKDDDLYINDIDDLRHIGEDICDGDIEWRIRTDEKGEVIASAIRAGTIKTTEVECFDKKRFDFKRTRINKSDWLDWCRNYGYSELADRFTYPSNALQQETDEGMEAVAGTSQRGDVIPGKMPRTAIGKLAINAAWQIECATGKRAKARQVIERLQSWVDHKDNPEAVTELTGKIPNGVKWVTCAGKERSHDIGACQKALETWNKSRD